MILFFLYFKWKINFFNRLNGRLTKNMLLIFLQLQGVWKNLGANTSTEDSAPPLGHSLKHIKKV